MEPPAQTRAPKTLAGLRADPPDYVGVGTACSGTAWWDDLINAHPRVSRPDDTPREIHFFDGLWERGLAEDDIERYHALFARPEGHLAGEWTPGYMLDAWTPALLRRAAPEARLLVLLRDPLERFRADPTSEGDAATGITDRAAANAAFSRGIYADQLQRLWSAFPREQVLVLQYEQCLADPRAQLERTYAFIGLEPEVPAGLDPSLSVGEPHRPAVTLDGEQEDRLIRGYAPENGRLASLLPELDLSLWRPPR